MPWEEDPLKTITNEGQLNSYKHYGFWQPMDTIRERTILEDLHASHKAPWVKW